MLFLRYSQLEKRKKKPASTGAWYREKTQAVKRENVSCSEMEATELPWGKAHGGLGSVQPDSLFSWRRACFKYIYEMKIASNVILKKLSFLSEFDLYITQILLGEQNLFICQF